MRKPAYVLCAKRVVWEESVEKRSADNEDQDEDGVEKVALPRFEHIQARDEAVLEVEPLVSRHFLQSIDEHVLRTIITLGVGLPFFVAFDRVE